MKKLNNILLLSSAVILLPASFLFTTTYTTSCNKQTDKDFEELKKEFLANFPSIDPIYYGQGKFNQVTIPQFKKAYLGSNNVPIAGVFSDAPLFHDDFNINEYNILNLDLPLKQEAKQYFSTDDMNVIVDKVKKATSLSTEQKQVLIKINNHITKQKQNIVSFIQSNQFILSTPSDSFPMLFDAVRFSLKENYTGSESDITSQVVSSFCDVYIKFLNDSFVGADFLSKKTPFSAFLDFIKNIKLRTDATLTQLICGIDQLWITILLNNTSNAELAIIQLRGEDNFDILYPMSKTFIESLCTTSDTFSLLSKDIKKSDVVSITFESPHPYIYEEESIPANFLNGFVNLKTFGDQHGFSVFKNVKTIGENFCKDCTSLEEIDLSSLTNVNFLGNNFLSNCAKLKTLKFKPSINYFTGTNFLNNCKSLPLTNATWGEEGFLHNLKYFSAIVPDGFLQGANIAEEGEQDFFAGVDGENLITSFGENFLKGSSIRNFNLNDFSSIQTIKKGFLSECESLAKIDLSTISTFDDDVPTIDGERFLYNCHSLKEIKREHVEHLDFGGKFINKESAFSLNLDDLLNPRPMLKGTDAANLALSFSNLSSNWGIGEGIGEIVLKNGAIINFDSTNTPLTTFCEPEEPPAAFSSFVTIQGNEINKSEITAIYFPEGYFASSTEIPDGFLKCDVEEGESIDGYTGLEQVEFSDVSNITKIGDDFLKGCTKLTTFSNANPGGFSSLAEIGNSFMAGCISMKSFSLESYIYPELTTIGDDFFAKNNLESVNLFDDDSKVISIGDNFFQESNSLKSINVHDYDYSLITHTSGTGDFSDTPSDPAKKGKLLGKNLVSFVNKFYESPIFATPHEDPKNWDAGEYSDNSSFAFLDVAIANADPAVTINLPISLEANHIPLSVFCPADIGSFVKDISLNGININTDNITQLALNSSYSSVTYIPDYFCYGYSSLKQLYISSLTKLTSIGDYFLSNSGVEDINLTPNILLSDIGDYFCSSSKVKKISLPSGVLNIGDYFFWQSDLEEFDFSCFSNLISIGSDAFSECDELERINVGIFSDETKIRQLIGENRENWFVDVKTTGTFFGENPSNLANFFSVDEDNDGPDYTNPFASWSYYPIINVNDNSYLKLKSGVKFLFVQSELPIQNLTASAINANSGKVLINSIQSSTDKTVKQIYINPDDIEEIEFGDSYSDTTSIPDDFCKNFVNLKTIDLQKFTHVTSIGNYFLYNTAIENVSLASMFESLTQIGDYFCSLCTKLSSVTLQPLRKLQKVGSNFLANCTALTTLDLSNWYDIGEIGDYFCYHCPSLTSIKIELWHVTTTDYSWKTPPLILGSYFFAFCSVLTEIQINTTNTKTDEWSNVTFSTSATGVTTAFANAPNPSVEPFSQILSSNVDSFNNFKTAFGGASGNLSNWVRYPAV